MKRTALYFILALIIVAGCSAYRTAKFNFMMRCNPYWSVAVMCVMAVMMRHAS
jgi:hypothetical protein